MQNPTVGVSSSEPALVLDDLRRRGLYELLEGICQSRGVVAEELCGRSRTCSVARARHELWCRIRDLPERHYSYSEIGHMFRRNTATILQGVAAHRRLIQRGRP